MQLLLEALALAVVGAAFGFAMNTASPRPVALGQPIYSLTESGSGEGSCSDPHAAVRALARIAVVDATAACDACKAAFVDARSAREFEQGHIAGAVHLPPKGHADEAKMLQTLATYPMVIVYDGDSSCRLAEGVAHRLLDAGLSDVRVLDGAWPGWIAAGGPGTSGICAECGNEDDSAHHREAASTEETK